MPSALQPILDDGTQARSHEMKALLNDLQESLVSCELAFLVDNDNYKISIQLTKLPISYEQRICIKPLSSRMPGHAWRNWRSSLWPNCSLPPRIISNTSRFYLTWVSKHVGQKYPSLILFQAKMLKKWRQNWSCGRKRPLMPLSLLPLWGQTSKHFRKSMFFCISSHKHKIELHIPLGKKDRGIQGGQCGSCDREGRASNILAWLFVNLLDRMQEYFQTSFVTKHDQQSWQGDRNTESGLGGLERIQGRPASPVRISHSMTLETLHACRLAEAKKDLAEKELEIRARDP